MKCLIGLGNPGGQYDNTKHNFGYWVVDSFLEKNDLKLKIGKGDYVFANTLYSAFKNAIAPLEILDAITCIFSLPGSCFETHAFL